mmetsp:Transcript_35708/g.47108  ORF Transcript_35708/g.47108 Transcript_35708/m.47108 type:complete len:110 (+) Transcript_35708:76-405(+)
MQEVQKERTHKTIRLPPQIQNPLSLTEICIKKLTENSTQIADISGLERTVALRLLQSIVLEKRLTYPLAKVFIDCGHEDISSALEGLNLWDAIPIKAKPELHRRCSDGF